MRRPFFGAASVVGTTAACCIGLVVSTPLAVLAVHEAAGRSVVSAVLYIESGQVCCVTDRRRPGLADQAEFAMCRWEASPPLIADGRMSWRCELALLMVDAAERVEFRAHGERLCRRLADGPVQRS